MDNHASAFKPFEHKVDEQKSFIVIKDKKCPVQEQLETRIRISLNRAPSTHEDSESTHHSHKSPRLSPRLSKDQKREKNLSSILSLLESRKSDTIQELEKFDEDDVVLKRNPKPASKNSKLSHYRGVSHNGKKWQVMIMGFAKKIYFGGIASEQLAAAKYDKYAILMHGLEVNHSHSCSVLTFSF